MLSLWALVTIILGHGAIEGSIAIGFFHGLLGLERGHGYCCCDISSLNIDRDLIAVVLVYLRWVRQVEDRHLTDFFLELVQ